MAATTTVTVVAVAAVGGVVMRAGAALAAAAGAAGGGSILHSDVAYQHEQKIAYEMYAACQSHMNEPPCHSPASSDGKQLKIQNTLNRSSGTQSSITG